MSKRLLLIAACGLLASFTLATPSQAASTLVTTSATLNSGDMSTYTGLVVTYTTAAGSVTNLTLTSNNTTSSTFPTPSTTAEATVMIKSIDFVESNGAHVTPTASGLTFREPLAIPEPASMSLLGIGMAGFFAFRRFFSKRNADV
jgi:hypothetical protein